MDLNEAIKGRRSIRRYKAQPIPDEVVLQLIEAATHAPSAGNIQPWHFLVAKNPEVKGRLAEAAYNQTSIAQAPVVIVVCVDENLIQSRYGTRGISLYCLQDAAAATQNLLLTAYSIGLGTCWIGAFDEKQVRESVNAPLGIRPVVMIPVGYADAVPRQRIRKPLSEVLHFNSF